MSGTNELIELQLSMQGAAVVPCSDGTLVYLTTQMLEKLLEKARTKGNGRVAIFSKKAVPS